MEKTEVKKVKGIYDIYLAAYLKSHNFPIVSTPQTRPYHLEVCFELTPKLELAIADYFAKEDKTHALDFIEQYRSLRAMLQALKSGNPEGRGR